ncbi:MAG: hypothetical protein ACXWW0_00085 [Bacteroidia bacterium]
MSKNSFKDVNGNWDGKRITAFVSFCWILLSAGMDQFLGKRPSEFIFLTFAGIVISLLGLSVPEYFSKRTQEPKETDTEI